MSNKNKVKDVAIQWLLYAKGDLKSAKVLIVDEDIPMRNVCYLVQQSVEKSLKALLILLKISIIKTHDLDLLVNKLPQEFKEKFDSFDLSWLSEWSVEARYPGEWSDATVFEARQAIDMGEDIIKIINDIFEEND
ncbi:MAG: HEPN domain-containing protein [Bacillota bacterium]|jgi:HEPN domain-containing protein